MSRNAAGHVTLKPRHFKDMTRNQLVKEEKAQRTSRKHYARPEVGLAAEHKHLFKGAAA